MSRASLRAAAWASAVLHALGLAAALLLMREGTPLVPLDQRLRYLTEHGDRWQLGWTIWGACAVALVVFAVLLARRIRKPAGWSALLAILLAAVVDLGCDLMYATTFLEVAASGPHPPFLAIERMLGVASVAIGNGLYTTGVLLFAFALRNEPAVPRWGHYAAIGCVAAGTAMAIAGLLGSAEGLAAATGPTIGLFAAWSLLVAHGLERS